MTEVFKYDESNIGDVEFLKGSEFEDCEFYGINFSGYCLNSVSFLNCKFIDCNLTNQNLSNVSLRDVTFESSNLVGLNWCTCKRLENLEFKNSKMTFSSFQGLKLKKSKIIECSVVDVDFSGTDLTLSDFAGSDLAGSNFEGATLEKVNFRTSKHYLFDLRKAKIKGSKFDLPHVLALISALGAEIEF